MGFFTNVKETAILTKDILRGINHTVWGGAEGVEKASRIVKNGITGTDSIIGISHAMEDLACQDHFCFALDVIGSASSTTGLILGNIPATKHLTVVTGSVTCVCRGVRYICKRYGTAWGCTVLAVNYTVEGTKKTVRIIEFLS